MALSSASCALCSGYASVRPIILLTRPYLSNILPLPDASDGGSEMKAERAAEFGDRNSVRGLVARRLALTHGERRGEYLRNLLGDFGRAVAEHH